MNNKETNFYKQDINKQIISDKENALNEKMRAVDRGLRNQPYSELNNFIQYAIGDNVQNFIDFDENGNQTLKNGIVRYNYDKKDKPIKTKNNAEIVIKNAFTESEVAKLQDELSNTLYKPMSQIKEVVMKIGKIRATTFNILLKKVELFFVEELYNNNCNGNVLSPTITIKDADLAKILDTDRGNLNRDMNKVIIALGQVQIRSFNWRKTMYSKRNGEKQEIPNLALINLIQDAVHEDGITQVTFNDKFAQHIALCSVLQTPKELYAVKDALTFDLILYLYGQVRQKKGNRFKIKIRTIYDTIKQIKRYEHVKGRNYQRDIYQPFEDAMKYLGKGTIENRRKIIKQGLGIANVNYENTDFIKDNGQYEFNKWLDTNLNVEIIKAPILKSLRDSREHYKQLAEKNIKKNK